MAREWLLEARDDSTLMKLGVVDDYDELELIPRFNLPGAWRLSVPVGSFAAEELTWGRGIVVSADGQEVFSGPVGRLERKWDSEHDLLEVAGADDSVWLGRRLAYPEAPALTTGSDAYDVRTGVCSTVLREYVDANLGASAHSSRRVAGLEVGGDPLLGDVVTGRGRFQLLADLFAPLALAAGDLGYRIVQEDEALVFRVYDPADLTARAPFSQDLGNLSAFEYHEEAPSVNLVVVGGSGEGTARVFKQGGLSSSINRYGRIEGFVDRRDTSAAGELAQAQEEALMEGAERSSLSISPVDTGGLSYLDDYGLGDRVRVMVDGAPIEDIIREVSIVLSDQGEVITPAVGTPGERDPRVLRLFSRVARLESRLRDLERR